MGRKLRWKIVRTGVTRTVLLTPNWAIKVPSMRGGNAGPRTWLWALTRGIQANMSEVEWSCATNVNPVMWSFIGLVNVYRRADALDHYCDDDCDPYHAVNELEGLTVRDEFGREAELDVKGDNVGLLDGRRVWIDYDQSWSDCISCRQYG